MRFSTGLLIFVLVGAAVAVVGPELFGTFASPLDGEGESGRTVSLALVGESSEPAYSFEDVTVERCGGRCVAMTAHLTNERTQRAVGVTVLYRVYAGKEASGSPVWTGRDELGILESEETVSVSERTSVSSEMVQAVRSSGGWISLVVVIESSEARVVFHGTEHVP